MANDWNKGWTGAEVEEDGSWLLHTSDGRTLHEADVSVTEDQYKAMWQGYTCAWCGEAWPQRWPESCTLVGCWSPNEMSEDVQHRYLIERYGGEKWFGPSKSTIDRLDNALVHSGATTGNVSVWIPRSWRPE